MAKMPLTKKVQGQYTAPLRKVVSQKHNPDDMCGFFLTLDCGHIAGARGNGAVKFQTHYCILCSPEYQEWEKYCMAAKEQVKSQEDRI